MRNKTLRRSAEIAGVVAVGVAVIVGLVAVGSGHASVRRARAVTRVAAAPRSSVVEPAVQPAAPLLAASSAVPVGAVATAGANVGSAVPVAVSPTRTGEGFWVASTDGAVSDEGDAVSHGDASNLPLSAPVVGIATTATGNGYWLLGSDGGVFSYGDAAFYGSTGGIHLNQPALQMVATASGHGYWFVARDGGVFSFGDAHFYGSTGGIRLAQPVVGMSAVAGGGGYWLVARDGGIFNYGDARFYGSAAGSPLASPVVGIAPTRTGRGYWLVARDGGIFNYGDARFYGSAAGSPLPAPVIGMVATSDGGGYWLVLGNGQVKAYGDAASIATTPIASTGFSLVGEVVGIDPGHNGGNGADPSYINQPIWNGQEYETCDTTGTETDAGYTEASFNFDVATRLEALLKADGATVVLTRDSNTGVGPCVTVRAAIINNADSDAAVDIHADGGPPAGRGFAVLEPVADGPNDAVISASDQLAVVIRDSMSAVTGEPYSSYDGVEGLQPRNNLAGLNLTTVPKILIECANMRNATDAALVTSPAWRQEVAEALAQGISKYLIGFS